MRVLVVALTFSLLAVTTAWAQATGTAEGNLKQKGIMLPPPVGTDLSLEQGYQAARATGLNLLSTVRATLGTLDKVRRIVKVLGMVNSAPGFTDQPKVINGFSDLMVEVFGEAIGKHARSAVGMAELPFNIPVEIEMIVEIE